MKELPAKLHPDRWWPNPGLQVLVHLLISLHLAPGTLAPGSWHLAPWHLAPGTWQLAAGSWQLAAAPGNWQLAPGSWQLAAGSWQLAAGSWHLAPGTWRLARGSWQLAPGSWQAPGVTASCQAPGDRCCVPGANGGMRTVKQAQERVQARPRRQALKLYDEALTT